MIPLEFYRIRTSSGRLLFLWQVSHKDARASARCLLRARDGHIVACGIRHLGEAEMVELSRRTIAESWDVAA